MSQTDIGAANLEAAIQDAAILEAPIVDPAEESRRHIRRIRRLRATTRVHMSLRVRLGIRHTSLQPQS